MVLEQRIEEFVKKNKFSVPIQSPQKFMNKEDKINGENSRIVPQIDETFQHH